MSQPDPHDDRLGVLLTAYADGTLHEEGCRFIEQQLEEHPELRQRLGEIGAAQASLRAGLPPAPERLDEARKAAILAQAQRGPARVIALPSWRLLVAAAIIVIVLGGMLLPATTMVREAARKVRIVEQLNDDGESLGYAASPAPTSPPPPMVAKADRNALDEDYANQAGNRSYGFAGKDAQAKQEGRDGKAVHEERWADGRTLAGGGASTGGAREAKGKAGMRLGAADKDDRVPTEPAMRADQAVVADLDLPAEQAAKEEENDAPGNAPPQARDLVARKESDRQTIEGNVRRLAQKKETAPVAAAPQPLPPPAAAPAPQPTATATPSRPIAGGRQKPLEMVRQRNPVADEAKRLTDGDREMGGTGSYLTIGPDSSASQSRGQWRGRLAKPGTVPSDQRKIESYLKQLEKADEERSASRRAPVFQAQAQQALNGQLGMVEAQESLQRLRAEDTLLDGLCEALGLPPDTESAPFRLLADPQMQVKAAPMALRSTAGERALHLLNRNALQLQPMPGGFLVQQAARALDPTSSFGWPRADLRAAFGSSPMQAVAEDAQQTFAIDAATGSFQAATIALRRGRLPDPGQIEPQHFYNAVPADYPAPQGEDAFALLAEAGPSPFARGPLAARTALVAIGVVSRPAAADERLPLDLVVALDASGSMGRPGGLQRARAGLAALLPHLDQRDRVAVVAFGDVARLVQPALRGDQRDRLERAVAAVEPGGSTNLADGIALACQVAGELASPGRANRVLLVTDGAALAGDAAPAAEAAVARWRGRGVSLLVVGCADEAYDAAALERLAQQGDGEHLVAGSDAQAAELFSSRLLPQRLAILARDAKAQVTWNPERVAFSRLIGFEKRRLAAEQFRDDSVDAGELAQDAQATALFEVVLTEYGSGPLGTAAVRYHDTRLGRVVELARPLPGGLVSASPSPRLRLLACAAELGETLQCGWWRNIRGPDEGRLALELARLDQPFARDLLDLERRFRALEQGLP